MAIDKIVLDDPRYPELLRQIHRPPKEIYVNGTLDAGRDKVAVAIVGSRRASQYGLETANRLGFELALRGVTVVSGMARGIDSASHRGALKAKGRTIAVMGSGHGNIYPPENEKLYEEIAATGAVVTEFPDDVSPIPQNFPMRNRIISGLSLGVVVVEAARNSGALITADFATEQGREVFAVPGKISSSSSSGTNALIKDGATLVQTVDDILGALSLKGIEPIEGTDGDEIALKRERKTKAYIYNALTEDERKIYKVLSDEPMHIDDLMTASKLARSKFAQAIINLEMKRAVKGLPGKHYVRSEVNG